MKIKRLPSVSVKKPCDVPWDAMTGTDLARQCARCDRSVHNLSAMNRDEAERLLEGSDGSRLCITYKRGPNGELITRDRPARFGSLVRMSAVAAAALAFSAPATANADQAPSGMSGGLQGVIRVYQLGEAVEGAEITARDSKTGREFSSKSVKDGRYRLLLPKGRYDVTINVLGFAACDIEGVDIGSRVLKADANVALRPIGEYERWDACGNPKLDKLRHKK
jgi:hypothetical protein